MATPIPDLAYCIPEAPDTNGFNPNAVIPCGVTVAHVMQTMTAFTGFIGFIDTQLATKGMDRFEDMLMPTNFSSMVGEFMTANIPKFCKTVVKNPYHNGHPDMLPAGKYPKDSAQHAGADGIEVKASRYAKRWQGYGAEDVWLMVFCYAADRPVDKVAGIAKAPFRFLLVCGALLEKTDWQFAGNSTTSRRTITASVTTAGYEKMMANWIYKAPGLDERQLPLITGDANEG
jgi:hypothetical protein